MINQSFNNSSRISATSPISALYQRRTLDRVVDLAHAISHDFLRRPYHYRNVPEEVADILSEFRSFVGFHPDWPDATQRAKISGNILSDLNMEFGNLRRTAISLIGKESSKNIVVMNDVLVNKVISLRESLKGLDGRVVSIGERQTRMIFQKAVEVLRCEEIAHIFGMSPIHKDDWPFNGVFNVDAAYLVEEITKRLLGPEITLCHRKFIVLQRVAHYAALTIEGVLDESRDWKNPEQTVALFGDALCWAKEMQNLLSNINIVRAWKDPDYRLTFEIAELDLLPAHPAGDIDLSGTELDRAIVANGMDFLIGTGTSGGEVCCSSGDACQTVYCNTRMGFTCIRCEE